MPFPSMDEWITNTQAGQRWTGTGWGAPGGGAAPAAPATPEKPKTASEISLEKMLAEAERLAGVEDTRFATEYGRLEQAGRRFHGGFYDDEERLSQLALGQQFDAIGRSALDQTRALRTSLGGRGIDPSSGTAAALASRIGLQKQSLRYGAMRGAAMDSYQRRNAQRTAQYAQQLNLAQFGNQSPSMINLDSLTNKAEFDLAREVSKDQVEAAKYAARKNAQASRNAGIGNIIGSIFSAFS